MPRLRVCAGWVLGLRAGAVGVFGLRAGAVGVSRLRTDAGGGAGRLFTRWPGEAAAGPEQAADDEPGPPF